MNAAQESSEKDPNVLKMQSVLIPLEDIDASVYHPMLGKGTSAVSLRATIYIHTLIKWRFRFCGSLALVEIST